MRKEVKSCGEIEKGFASAFGGLCLIGGKRTGSRDKDRVGVESEKEYWWRNE